ncbi:MAG: ASKHA domain-containing protein [Phycisphaerales bacterium]|nr:ASKHA domain-containing protein [Phycisphaerales bacterium]
MTASDQSHISGADEGQRVITVETPESPPRTLCKGAIGRTASGTASLSDFLRAHGIPLNTRCGGRGLCESCTVELLSGTLTHISGKRITAGNNGESISPTSTENACGVANHSPKVVAVKACEMKIPELSEAVPHIRVPARSYLRYTPQIVTDYRVNIPCGHDPLYKASAEDKVILNGRPPLGVAVDIGTTTVALLLVNLDNGKVLAQAAMFNQQMNLGDDVVTRIDLCARDKAMIGRLQGALAQETLSPLIASALQHAKMNIDQILCFSIAGNTVMLHLAAGVDPTPLGTAPFTPAFLAHKLIDGSTLFQGGDSLPKKVAVHLLPSAAAYVGADLTAGVVASGMLYDQETSLLVDVGTNGEIVLKHKDQFLGCATAAGPAFEGAGLSCGMRAGDNVIAYVHISGSGDSFKVHTETIGDSENHLPHKKKTAVGLCGSAYIDFLAEGRRSGLLGETGRFDADFDARGHIIPWDADRDRAFRLGFAPGRQAIAISQRDIASLLQAKAATAAGVLTLLTRVGLTPKDVKKVYLAGGFGTKMNAGNAIACGLLPGFAPEQIQPVGNTSLAGAYLALLDRSLLSEMRHVGEAMKIVELNLDPSFEGTYIEQLMLP